MDDWTVRNRDFAGELIRLDVQIHLEGALQARVWHCGGLSRRMILGLVQ